MAMNRVAQLALGVVALTYRRVVQLLLVPPEDRVATLQLIKQALLRQEGPL
jgi:hypothetical protein